MEEKHIGQEKMITPFQVVGDSQGNNGTCGPNGCNIADHWNKKRTMKKGD